MLPTDNKLQCPECNDHSERVDSLDRRNFLRLVGGGAASVAVGGVAAPRILARSSPPEFRARIVRELTAKKK